MDASVAKLILLSLCQRAERTKDAVVLTSAELAALQVLFGDAKEIQSFGGHTLVGVDDEQRAHPFEPDVTWHPSPTTLTNLLLCIDFGTSFSKAFACIEEEADDIPTLVDVTFGLDSQGQPSYLLPSELFIYKNEIYFGRAARTKFEVVEADQDSLIDNPKQYITLGHNVAELNQKPLRSEQDKNGRFTQRDVLVLYLAHLIHKVNSSLVSKKFVGDYHLRYAHPAWDKSTAASNGHAMARIVAEAMAIAKAYPSDLEEFTSIDRAILIADAAKTTDDAKLPFALLKESVREATAAGAGALMDTRSGDREAFVILDIGAGTSDVAACICVKHSKTGRVVVSEVVPAAKAIPQAGNIIDNALLRTILEESGLANGTTEYDRTRQSLRKNIRAIKESLFNDGFVLATLATGNAVEVDLTEFLASKPMAVLYEKLRALVCDAALSVADKKSNVYLVPTGGGARLPLIDRLVSEPVRGDDGQLVQLKAREAMPTSLKAPYPALVGVYPQVAVAIGGALPDLPQQITGTNGAVTDPGRKTLGPMYRS